jgi:hypothetical protein
LALPGFIVALPLVLASTGCAHKPRPGESTEPITFAADSFPIITIGVAGTRRDRAPQPFLTKVNAGSRQVIGEDGTPTMVPVTKVEKVTQPPAGGEYLVIEVDFQTSGENSAIVLPTSCQLHSGARQQPLYVWGEVEGVTGYSSTKPENGLAPAAFEVPVGKGVRKRFMIDYSSSMDTGLLLACGGNLQVPVTP